MRDELLKTPIFDCDIGIFASLFLNILETIKVKEMQVTIISYGLNINEIDDTKVILYGNYITYSVLFRLCIPKVCPVPFASELIMIPK